MGHAIASLTSADIDPPRPLGAPLADADQLPADADQLPAAASTPSTARSSRGSWSYSTTCSAEGTWLEFPLRVATKHFSLVVAEGESRPRVAPVRFFRQSAA